jgi:release factor glutamine methyltransferase
LLHKIIKFAVMTTEWAYNDFLERLEPVYEKQEALNIADWVFENTTGLKKWERRVHKYDELNEEAERQIKNYLHELLQHKPVQYVLQEAWFYKMKFFVNEDVLIPRPETEELVGWIVKDVRERLPGIRDNELRVLDIGTGSGCIAISLKMELPGSQITGVDISAKALSVAKKNADVLQTQIDFLQINFLDESLWSIMGMYDVMVSNPPYIPEIEKEKLAKNVTAFEPAVALFVRNNDPFIFYEKIARFGQSHLKENGKIFVEIHEDYSGEVKQIFTKYNFKTEIKEDIYGKKRMIKIM